MVSARGCRFPRLGLGFKEALCSAGFDALRYPNLMEDAGPLAAEA
ncbi:hypothetical protein LJR290_007658 [Variovorax sp. LjRoot290]